jgi:hypothetical protein
LLLHPSPEDRTIHANAKFQTELRTKAALEPIKKLDTQLQLKPLSFKPSERIFRTDNERLLRQVIADS